MSPNSSPKSLADKLKSLGVKVGVSELKPAKPVTQTGNPVESVVEGRYLPTHAGETFLVEQSFPADYRHGHVPLGLASRVDALADWVQDLCPVETPLEAYAFLDA